jgi:urea transport system substrate-binding protein
VRSLPPRPPRDLCAAVPPDLEAICLQCLAKSPQNRPPTAADLAGNLVLFLERYSVALAPSAPVAPVRPGGTAPVCPQLSGLFSAGTKRYLSRRGWAAATTLLLLGALLLGRSFRPDRAENAALVMKEPIKVGILFSLRGPMSNGGSAAFDSALLAIEELNEQGGLLGRPIEAIAGDGESNFRKFAELAEKFITEDHVAALFGCRASSNRKAVLPVVEKHDNLLFYPMQFEGLEESPNIIYLGTAPNQQMFPAVEFMVEKRSKRRLFLVGSDYVFPHAANAVLRDYMSKKYPEVSIVGERYVPFGSTEVHQVIRAIQNQKPDLILNTINGDSNVAFFRELHQAGLRAESTPVLSFSLGENDLLSIGKDGVGHYSAWSYFQSIDRPENAAFVGKFRKRFGSRRVVSDPMETVYFGIHLWARAVQQASSLERRAVVAALKGEPFAAPEGDVCVDRDTPYTWRALRIGRVDAEERFQIVFNTEWALRPEPFPSSRSRAKWEQFLQDLYKGWDGCWGMTSQ